MPEQRCEVCDRDWTDSDSVMCESCPFCGATPFYEPLPDVPAGFKKVETGSIFKGDMVFNVGKRIFEKVRMNGYVVAEQCHLVARRMN